MNKSQSRLIFTGDYFEQHFDINPVARRSTVTSGNTAAIIDTNGNTRTITAAAPMAYVSADVWHGNPIRPLFGRPPRGPRTGSSIQRRRREDRCQQYVVAGEHG